MSGHCNQHTVHTTQLCPCFPPQDASAPGPTGDPSASMSGAGLSGTQAGGATTQSEVREEQVVDSQVGRGRKWG